MVRLLIESENEVMLKTVSSEGIYYLIKSATRNKSYWNKQLSYVNFFAKKETAIKKLYSVLEKFPENAFYDEDDMYDIEDVDDLKTVRFAKFYITDSHGEELEDISKAVKDYLLKQESFISRVIGDDDDEDDEEDEDL